LTRKTVLSDNKKEVHISSHIAAWITLIE